MLYCAHQLFQRDLNYYCLRFAYCLWSNLLGLLLFCFGNSGNRLTPHHQGSLLSSQSMRRRESSLGFEIPEGGALGPFDCQS